MVKLSARIIGTAPLARGFLSVTRYAFEIDLHGGGARRVEREVMERGHAVAVLGYDPRRDEVVLVNEFRPGLLVAGDDPYTDNLCAGGIGAGESALSAAMREMKEETALELRDPIVIHPGAYVSSGGTSEKIVIVFGLVDSANAGGIHGSPEEHEDIRVVVMSAERFLERVRAAEITDLKTLVAGYWLAEHRAELRGGPA
jgi:ADP-ribose pyrophosphatase